jgi:hypothetical protein
MTTTIEETGDFLEYYDGEYFARHAESIPTARKVKIMEQLMQTAARAGAVAMEDLIDYLSDPEKDLLVGMLGLRYPVNDTDLVKAIENFVFTIGLSAEKMAPLALHRR